MRPGPRRRQRLVDGELSEPRDDDTRTREELLDEVRQLRMEVVPKSEGLGSQQAGISVEERTRIVLELSPQFPLAGLLKLAGLARSTFYYQRKALSGEDKQLGLRDAIREIFERNRGWYGYRRVTQACLQGHNERTTKRCNA